MPSFHESLLEKLQQTASYIMKSEDLVSYQILGSTDQLSCVCIGKRLPLIKRHIYNKNINIHFISYTGAWKEENALNNLHAKVNDPFSYIRYQQLTEEIQKIAVPGTISDILDRTGFPTRYIHTYTANIYIYIYIYNIIRIFIKCVTCTYYLSHFQTFDRTYYIFDSQFIRSNNK